MIFYELENYLKHEVILENYTYSQPFKNIWVEVSINITKLQLQLQYYITFLFKMINFRKYCILSLTIALEKNKETRKNTVLKSKNYLLF
jgi:hypothetical protein